MKSLTLKKTLNIVLILAVTLLPLVTAAQGIFGSGEPLPGQFEQDTDTVTGLIIKILEILLAVVGLVALLFLVYGAFLYITSSGDEERIKTAKGTMINALIGIVVVLLAFALVRIVANAVLGGTSGI